jgi:predicted ABC-type exoprotein transport system permease subunit
MDEVDVEGEPIFQSVERTMKDDTDRVLFIQPNQDLCQFILEDIDTWMATKFEHYDDSTECRQDHNVKIFSTTTDQRKIQKQVKSRAYAKILVKTCCAVNPHKETGDFDYAPSRPTPHHCLLCSSSSIPHLQTGFL